MKTVLYLNMLEGDRIQQMKLSGMRRYARARGWNVEALTEADSRPARIRRALASYHPIGCIVECSVACQGLEPRIFGGLPVVYVDCPRSQFGGRVPRVVHDGKATTRAAFRELASNRPSGYAVVGFKLQRYWSRLRERAFRRLCEEAGKDCAVFPWRSEGRSERIRRLSAWLAALPEESAVFAVNDEMAQEVLEACRLVGRRVPTDMTVLGVDNLAGVYDRADSMLSSVHVDFEMSGYRAARLLNERIRRGARAGNLVTYGPMMTVRRESTRGFGRRETRILSAVELIRQEACNGLTARDVIRRFRGSRSLINLRFRETLGHSILDEIQNVRFENVCMYLLQTDVPIGEIAALCGFRTDIALRKMFRQRTGMSLLAWRRSYGGR